MTDFGRRLPLHKVSHQDGGADEISVAGLVGTTPGAILGDGTPGRHLRLSHLTIQDGTNPDTIGCILVNQFNGDSISYTDNIAKGATTGDYYLTSDGADLTIKNTGLSGTAKTALIVVMRDQTTRALSVDTNITTSGISFFVFKLTTGAPQSFTINADFGPLRLSILYITDA